ncbi:MAG: sugar ABC transporter permease [Spirochaetales bacterium]|jgi:multiple sugar transport system permease protein|nr:sugar ABC transporter permease [Spirochaetales bacterium]
MIKHSSFREKYLASPLKREDFYTGLFCLAPSLIIVILFVVIPIFYSLGISFFDWKILSKARPFIGFGNYVKMFQNAEFWLAMKNTALYTLGVVPIGAVISLAMALLLNRPIKFAGFFKTAFFLPVITSTIAVAIVWLWIYNDHNGLINIILRSLHIKPVGWLTSPKTALLSVMIMSIWKNVGYHMVIFLAGLNAIPESYYEAATLAGATSWQKFTNITWPMIVPATLFVLITNTIFSFQVFGPVYTMTGGGPVRSTTVIVYHLYVRAFEFQEMGYASAVAWIIFLMLIALTAIQLKLSGKEKLI